MRNQDAILKVTRDGKELKWIFSPPLGWGLPWREKLLAPVGADFEWPYHQHAPRLLPNGNLLVFDNGNARATPPLVALEDPVRYSRAVEYRIDESSLAVEQVWSYGGAADPWYSFFLGVCERMPRTGNVLVTDGGKQVSPTVRQGYARVFEVTHAEEPEIVFEFVVRDEATLDALSWNVYRSERLVSLDWAE
jgi:hypothetical protein